MHADAGLGQGFVCLPTHIRCMKLLLLLPPQGVVNDWRIIAAWPLLMLIDLLLKTPPVARALFDNLAKPGTITKVLSGVYVDQAAVDEELVDIILQPAFTPNALDVFVSVITGALTVG